MPSTENEQRLLREHRAMYLQLQRITAELADIVDDFESAADDAKAFARAAREANKRIFALIRPYGKLDTRFSEWDWHGVPGVDAPKGDE
jgi:hypothetical protein